MFLWRIDGWFIKGQINSEKERNIRGCVTVLNGFAGGETMIGYGWGYSGSATICSSCNSLASASSICVMDASCCCNITGCEIAIASYCSIPSDPPRPLGQSQVVTKIDLNLGAAEHLRRWGGGTVYWWLQNAVEIIMKLSGVKLQTVDLMITGGTSILRMINVYIFFLLFHKRLSSAKCS